MAIETFTVGNQTIHYDTVTGSAVDSSGRSLAATPGTGASAAPASGAPTAPPDDQSGMAYTVQIINGQAVYTPTGQTRRQASAAQNGVVYASGGPGTGTPSPSSTPATPPTPPTDYTAQTKALFPWIPAALVQVFADAWSKYGDTNLAMAALREDPSYSTYFPGLRRDDGTVRATEGEYLSTMEGYDRELASFGLDPASFQAQKIQAFTNGRSPNEVSQDLGQMYLGIVSKGDEYRNYYAQNYGVGDISNTALLHSALDQTISPVEAQRRIAAAQVGGAAKIYGFDLAKQEADRLQSFGLNDQAAQQLFAKAKNDLPTLNGLAQRFNDPNDPLTAESYANAIVLNDPSQLAHIGRLFAQQGAAFSGQGSTFTADQQTGAERGLLSR